MDRLTDAKYQNLLGSGVNAALTLEDPSGNYRLRAVAVEGSLGQISAQPYAVQIP